MRNSKRWSGKKIMMIQEKIIALIAASLLITGVGVVYINDLYNDPAKDIDFEALMQPSPDSGMQGISGPTHSEFASTDEARVGMIDIWYAEENTELVSAAIDFIKSHDLFADLIHKFNDAEWYGWSYGPVASIYTYQEDGNWLSVNLWIANEKNFEFELIEVWSSLIFGEPKLTSLDAVKLVADTDKGKRFLRDVDNFRIYVSFQQVFEHEEYDNYIKDWYQVSSDQPETDNSEASTMEARMDTQSSYMNNVQSREPGYYHHVYFYQFINENQGSSGQNNDTDSDDSSISSYYQIEWLSGIVEDYTNSIVYLFGTIPATKSEEEVLDFVLSSSEVSVWLEVVKNYNSQVYYTGYGSWSVYISSNDNYYDYIYALVLDDPLEFDYIGVWISVEAEMTETEVLALAYEEGLEDFKTLYPNVQYYIDYNQYGTWYIGAYSTVFYEVYLWMEINDSTGEVTYKYQNDLKNFPNLTIEEVEAIFLTDENYTKFISLFDDYQTYLYYYNSMWYGGAWINLESADASVYVSVDDKSQEIVESWYYYYEYDSTGEEEGSEPGNTGDSS
jgi:hypothetical protein